MASHSHVTGRDGHYSEGRARGTQFAHLRSNGWGRGDVWVEGAISGLPGKVALDAALSSSLPFAVQQTSVRLLPERGAGVRGGSHVGGECHQVDVCCVGPKLTPRLPRQVAPLRGLMRCVLKLVQQQSRAHPCHGMLADKDRVSTAGRRAKRPVCPRCVPSPDRHMRAYACAG
eukprot:scaffold337_cov393-Prasinococcus_capsulatus_cf.AAC.14